MGGGVGIVVVLVLVVIGLLVWGTASVVRGGKREIARQDLAKSDQMDTLTYVVPEGQDPAAVMAALRQEGFEPVRDRDTPEQRIIIPCREGLDRVRPQVRVVIRDAGLNLDDDSYRLDEVRFVDE